MRCDIKNSLLRHCHCSVYTGPLELARVRDENPVSKTQFHTEGGDVTVATLLGFEARVRKPGAMSGFLSAVPVCFRRVRRDTASTVS